MASVNSTSPSATADLVAIFDENFKQLFEGALPMTVQVIERANLAEHPLERGTIIADHIIFLPTEIDVNIVMPEETYRQAMSELNDAYYDVAGPFTVQTRAITYVGMYIVGLPHEEKPEHIDAIFATIKFKQARIITPEDNMEPRDDADLDTTDSGEVSPEEPEDPYDLSDEELFGVEPDEELTDVAEAELDIDRFKLTPSQIADIAFGVANGLASGVPLTEVAVTALNPVLNEIAGQQIPLNALVNQRLTVAIASDLFAVQLTELSGGNVSYSLARNGIQIVTNALAVSGEPLIPYSADVGGGGTNFIFNTSNGDLPRAGLLGVTQTLIHYNQAQVTADRLELGLGA